MKPERIQQPTIQPKDRIEGENPLTLLTDPSIIADTLIYLRGRRSIAECAERAGVAESTWRRWERGRRAPLKMHVPKILEGLQCSVRDFDLMLWKRMAQKVVVNGVMSGELDPIVGIEDRWFN